MSILLFSYIFCLGGSRMGIIRVGNVEYESRNVSFVSGSIALDCGVSIFLCDNPSPVQFKGEDCSVRKVVSTCDLIICGSVKSALANKNMVVWGKIGRSSCGRNRFYNYTASGVYKSSKADLRKRHVMGKRVVVHLIGEFDSVTISAGVVPTEVYLEGSVGRAVSDKDIIVSGDVSGARSEANTYVSRR